MNEEDLQIQAEMGHERDHVDAQAYKKVFDALKQEPAFHLPETFADQVVLMVEIKRENARDRLWMAVGIFLFVAAAVIAIVLTDFKIDVEAYKFLSGYSGFVIFGLAFVVALQWIDRKLIRQRPTF